MPRHAVAPSTAFRCRRLPTAHDALMDVAHDGSGLRRSWMVNLAPWIKQFGELCSLCSDESQKIKDDNMWLEMVLYYESIYFYMNINKKYAANRINVDRILI